MSKKKDFEKHKSNKENEEYIRNVIENDKETNYIAEQDDKLAEDIKKGKLPYWYRRLNRAFNIE